MRFPRMTTRRWMIVIALVAVVLSIIPLIGSVIWDARHKADDAKWIRNPSQYEEDRLWEEIEEQQAE